MNTPTAAPPDDRLRLLLPLREAVLDADRRDVAVTCLRPGLSRNGNFYGPGCLRDALPLFEGARCYIDHAPSPQRSVRDLAGVFHQAHLADDGAVRATLRVSAAHDWLWTLVRESVADGTDLVGLSVDCTAHTRMGEHDGTPCRIVERITTLQSVDVVTRAAAGGSFDALREADRQSWWDQLEPANEAAAALAGAAAASGVPIAGQQVPVPAGSVPPIQIGPTAAQAIPGGTIQLGGVYVTETIEEAAPVPAVPVPPTPPAPPPAPPQADPGARALAEVERLREALEHERALAAAERLLEASLRDSALPAPAQARLRAGLAGRPLSGDEIARAIQEEGAYLSSVAGLGRVTGLGYERTLQVGLSERDRLQKAFDQLFGIQEGESVPPLSGIREAYVAVTRDVEISGVTDPARLQEADLVSASFANLLGTSMNKRLLKDYQAWPSEWQKFVTITPIRDFRQQDRIRMGAFGSLSTVAEDAPYTTLTLSDTKASYSPAKRGNLVAVSREAIINDDLHALLQIPSKLAASASYTTAEFLYLLTAANGTAIYDTYKLFDTTNHKNTGIATASLGTAGSGAALTTAAMQTAVAAMRRQTNLAGKPIGLKPRFLVVPPELEFVAMTIVKSAGAPGTNFNDINPMLGYAEVIVAPQITSPTFWMLVADPRVVDTIEIGFVGGQMNPQLFIQDQPLFGNNFTNDVITYKVRHEYGGAVVDYRGFYLGNN